MNSQITMAILEKWLWENVGPGGRSLKPAVGCEGFDDKWDGDLWQFRHGQGLMFKEDRHAMLFMLRWS